MTISYHCEISLSVYDMYSHQHLLPSTLGRRGSNIQPPLRGRSITSATIQQRLETPRDPSHVRYGHVIKGRSKSEVLHAHLQSAPGPRQVVRWAVVFAV